MALFSERRQQYARKVVDTADIVRELLVIGSPSARANYDNNGSQDEKQMIQTGLAVAPVPLNMGDKDPDMVGLGDYIVKVTGDRWEERILSPDYNCGSSCRAWCLARRRRTPSTRFRLWSAGVHSSQYGTEKRGGQSEWHLQHLNFATGPYLNPEPKLGV